MGRVMIEEKKWPFNWGFRVNPPPVFCQQSKYLITKRPLTLPNSQAFFNSSIETELLCAWSICWIQDYKSSLITSECLMRMSIVQIRTIRSGPTSWTIDQFALIPLNIHAIIGSPLKKQLKSHRNTFCWYIPITRGNDMNLVSLLFWRIL